MSDRTVHATTVDGAQIVRYDRAGKWYCEYEDGVRFELSIANAVRHATRVGSYVYFDRPGGKTFDARVRATAEKMRA